MPQKRGVHVRNSLFAKTWRSVRWQLLGWTIGIISMAWITLALYPSFSQSGIEGIIGSIPDSLKSVVGSVADFKTIPGYIGQQIFGPNIYIIGLVMAIITFMVVSASEESDGRLQAQLALPISRTRLYLTKWLVAATSVVLASFSILIGICLALYTIHESADVSRILLSAGAFAVLNLAYGTLLFAVSFATGRKKLAVLISCGYTVGSLFITSLAPSVKGLDGIDAFSLLHYYNSPQIMSHGIDGTHMSVLILTIVVVLMVGWIGFIKRDVRSS